MRQTLLAVYILLFITGYGTAQDKLTSYDIALQYIQEATANGATELGLSLLDLTQVPPEIGHLTNLEQLYLDGNQLMSLPPEIGQLVNLQVLYLNNNQLMSLPPEIGRLTQLQWLYLNNNQLTFLPLEIWQLTNLQSLNLNVNHLTTLPPEIGQLTNLKYFALAYNQLHTLPLEVGQLELCVLNLASNNILYLPTSLGNMTSLTPQEDCFENGLVMDNNPLISPPPEVVEQGTAAVLAYLRNQAWYHLQRLIVGTASGVGLLALLFLGLRFKRRGVRKQKNS